MVPNRWRDLYLNEFAKIIVSPVDKKTFENEIPVKLCNYTDVYYNERITKSISFMNATAKKSEIEKFTLELDDVIITKDSETPGDIAVPALVAEDLNGVVCGYHLAIVRTNKKLALGSFINYLFSMPEIRYYFFTLATGATRFGLSIGGINKAHFRLPPTPEQRKIATILGTWDKAISTTERLIDNSKQQKKALMQQLLTGKKRLLDDSGKSFEGEWKESTVGSLGTIYSGGTPSTSNKEYWDGDINWITPTDITKQDSVYINSSVRRISSEGLKNSSAKLVPKGSLLVCTRATIGEMAITAHEMCTNQGFKNIIPYKNTNIEFFFYLLTYEKHKLVSKASGSTFLELSKSAFESMKFNVPSIDEQEKIADVLTNAYKEIDLLEQQLSDLKQEKTALMQQLLTGKRRVKVDEKDVA